MTSKCLSKERVEFCSKKTVDMYKKTLIIYPVICLVYFFDDFVRFLGGVGIDSYFLDWNGFVSGFGEDRRSVVLFSWLYVISFCHGFVSVFFDIKTNVCCHFSKKPWGFFGFSVISVGLMAFYPFHGDTHVARVVSYGGYISLVLNGWLFSAMAFLFFFAPVCWVSYFFLNNKDEM